MKRSTTRTTRVITELSETDLRDVCAKLGLIPPGWEYYSVAVEATNTPPVLTITFEQFETDTPERFAPPVTVLNQEPAPVDFPGDGERGHS